MSIEPSSIKQVAVVCAKAHQAGRNINVIELSRAIALVIAHHAPQGHGYEVAWALWMSLCFSCTIDEPTALIPLSKMNDSAVALLALDAQDRGLLPGFDLDYWSSLMTQSELYGANWLLSYEARVRNWLGTAGGGDHVAADASFNFLKQHNVRFYRRVRRPTRRIVELIPNWRPEYGVEAVPGWLR